MNILDENIRYDQREKLRRYKIRFRQIGYELAERGIDDKEQVIPLLLQVGNATFFTRDRDFCDAKWRHDRYCLAHLSVRASDVADAIRRLLKHPEYNTVAKRMGKIIRVGEEHITLVAK